MNTSVEMYVSGEEYDSMGVYRVQRLSKFLEMYLSDTSEKDYKDFKKALFSNFSIKSFNAFTLEELEMIISAIYSNKARPTSVIRYEELDEDEINAMFDVYKKSKGIQGVANVDISNMKTIQIGK